MKILSLILTLLVFASCAKKNPAHKVNPIKDLVAQRDVLLAQSKQSQVFPILTKTLDLVYPNKDRSGKIMLIGKDAEKLYQAMRLVSKNVNDSDFYSSMNQKRGEAVTCTEMVSIDDSEPVTYGCEISLRYDNGSLNLKSNTSATNEEIPRISEDYNGFNLNLRSEDVSNSSVVVKGNSALVLYSIMNVVEEYGTNNELKKSGKDYFCLRAKSTSAEDDVVTCTLKFNHETGSI